MITRTAASDAKLLAICHFPREALCRCVAICILSSSLFATAPLTAETLNEAIEDAYVKNPSLEASRASSRAAKERILQAKAQFGPSLNANAGYEFGWRRVTQNGVVALEQKGFTPQLSASVDQPLFTFGRLTAQSKIASAGYAASIADLRAAQQDLLANVIIAYASVLRDEKLVAIANENVAQLAEQLDQTSARYTARYATETELQQTRNRIFTGQAQLDLALGNLLASRNNYRNVVGRYPEDLAPLPQLPAVPATAEDAQQLAMAASPVIDAAKSELDAARGRVAQARGTARPQVGLQASISRTPLSIETDDIRELSATARIGVSIPLYSGGFLSARTREAAQLADASSQQVEQTTRDVRESVASHWDQLSAARRAIPAYMQAVSAAQKALDGARQQQLAGQITSLDVLDTARDLLISRQAQAQSEAQLYIQHALLLGSMGQLRPDAFAPGTPSYDPSMYSRGGWAGLPSGPLIEALDGIAYDDHFKPSPVAVEHDSEPGHEMAAEPTANDGTDVRIGAQEDTRSNKGAAK